MVRVDVLASGSSGNLTVIRSGRTKVLLDAGPSCKRILELFEQAGLDPASIDAVLISHEHSDHIGGLRVFLKKYPRPVFVSDLSAPYLGLEREAERLVRPMEPGEAMTIGHVSVTPFPVPHDAEQTFGFVFRAEGMKIGCATDLGTYSADVVGHLKGANCLLLEFNHDLDMLHEGCYPQHLKIRIAGKLGHLSNGQGAKLLSKTITGETAGLFLMHLSRENTTPESAKLAASACVSDKVVFFEVAGQYRPTRPWIG